MKKCLVCLINKENFGISTKRTICLTGEEMLFAAYEDICSDCGLKKKKEKMVENGWKKDFNFWKTLKPENEALFKKIFKGWGSLEHYLTMGKTKEQWLEKNSKLSVGEEKLRKSGKTEEEIKEIKSKHSKNSAITLEHFKKSNSSKDAKDKHDKWLSTSRTRSNLCKEYWIERGHSEIEAAEIISKRQMRDLSYYVDKYGEVEGFKRYTNSNKLKSSSLENFIRRLGEEDGTKKYLEHKGKTGTASIQEKKMIDLIYNYYLSKKENTDDLFSYKSKQFVIGIKKEDWAKYEQKCFLVDFCDNKRKKIIEFNGNVYHANPEMFKEYECPHPFKKDKTAGQIWKTEAERNLLISKFGYEILIIWERNFLENEEREIDKCIKFLFGE
jgi:very-short-patch-repair endonuclease